MPLPSGFTDDSLTDNVGTVRAGGNTAVEEPEVEEPKAPAEDSKIKDILSGQAAEIAKTQLMAQLAGDPDYRAVMDMKNRGVKFKLVPEGEPGHEPTNEKVEWDNLTNAQMAEKLPTVMTRQMKEVIEAAVAPLHAKIQQLENVSQNIAAEKVQSQIAEVSKKYKDFDELRPMMIQLNQQKPGNDLEDLYWMARRRSGKPMTDVQPTSVERPTTSTARPSPTQRKQALPPGKRGFSMLLDEALNKKEGLAFED